MVDNTLKSATKESQELEALHRLDEECVQQQKTGNYLQAFDCMERALVLRRHFFGIDSPEVSHACRALAEMCNLLAMSFLQQDNYGVTIDLLKKAEILTQQHPAEKATTLNNLACYYRRLGKLHAAMTCLKRALEIEKRLHNVRNAADTHLNICAVLSQLGKHDQALTSAQEALLTLQEQFFEGKQTNKTLSVSQKTADDLGDEKRELTGQLDRVSVMCIAYHNIGVEQEFLKDYANSAMSYKKGVGLAEQYLGLDHPITTTIRNSYLAAKRNISTKIGGKAKQTGNRGGGILTDLTSPGKASTRLLNSPHSNGMTHSLRLPSPLTKEKQRQNIPDIPTPRSIIADALSRSTTLPPLESPRIKKKAAGLDPADPFFSPRFRFDASENNLKPSSTPTNTTKAVSAKKDEKVTQDDSVKEKETAKQEEITKEIEELTYEDDRAKTMIARNFSPRTPRHDDEASVYEAEPSVLTRHDEQLHIDDRATPNELSFDRTSGIVPSEHIQSTDQSDTETENRSWSEKDDALTLDNVNATNVVSSIHTLTWVNTTATDTNVLVVENVSHAGNNVDNDSRSEESSSTKETNIPDDIVEANNSVDTALLTAPQAAPVQKEVLFDDGITIPSMLPDEAPILNNEVHEAVSVDTSAIDESGYSTSVGEAILEDRSDQAARLNPSSFVGEIEPQDAQAGTNVDDLSYDSAKDTREAQEEIANVSTSDENMPSLHSAERNLILTAESNEVVANQTLDNGNDGEHFGVLNETPHANEYEYVESNESGGLGTSVSDMVEVVETIAPHDVDDESMHNADNPLLQEENASFENNSFHNDTDGSEAYIQSIDITPESLPLNCSISDPDTYPDHSEYEQTEEIVQSISDFTPVNMVLNGVADYSSYLDHATEYDEHSEAQQIFSWQEVGDTFIKPGEHETPSDFHGVDHELIPNLNADSAEHAFSTAGQPDNGDGGNDFTTESTQGEFYESPYEQQTLAEGMEHFEEYYQEIKWAGDEQQHSEEYDQVYNDHDSYQAHESVVHGILLDDHAVKPDSEQSDQGVEAALQDPPVLDKME